MSGFSCRAARAAASGKGLAGGPANITVPSVSYGNKRQLTLLDVVFLNKKTLFMK